MDLLDMINNCTIDQLDAIIDNALNQAIASSDKKEVLGFGKDFSTFTVHKGLINPETRIKYSGLSPNYYSMKTTDYYYEFAKYLKQCGVKNKGYFIKVVENFINNYFGIKTTQSDIRDAYFDLLAWQTTKTDEEYFAKLDALEIGDLKGRNIAMCTERAAVAQNLLSLFGIETYYCIGCVDNEQKEEAHCFNIARAKNSFVLLDYSIPCPIIRNEQIVDWAPFQGNIELDEFEDFLANGVSKTFNSYVYTPNGIKKEIAGETRTYIVGSFSLKNQKEAQSKNSKN